MEEVKASSDVAVIGNKAEEFNGLVAVIPQDKMILDLVRIEKGLKTGGNYHGIAW